MLKRQNLPAHSECRQLQSIQNQYCWFRPNQIQEHITSANEKSFNDNPNRPHLNITLDHTHKVKALVDSGSSICLGDSSIIRYLKN